MNRKHTKTIVWIGVILMLVAMAVYVLTLDESEPLPIPEEKPAGETVE